jgi:TPR repeat protein
MKYYIKLLLLLFVTSNTSIAQTNDTFNTKGIDSATLYLTGAFKSYNPQRAFQINLHNAAIGNAKAMNALAMHYTKGLGVDSNFNLAAYWFSQAATNGYTKALVNLGMLYKHKANDSAGYSIACSYFNQALQANEPTAFFAQGYMYYKGLGCTQSYNNALQLFNQGITLNQANCMYFKGLCYKFGYGVTINNDSANYYINNAALLGYKQANAELYNNNSNSTTARHSSSVIARNEAISTHNITTEYSRINKTNNTIKLSGEYVGALNQYDYSGKKLIAQIPIALQVSTSNNVITGDLIFNNSQSIQLKAIQQGNQLIFSQTAVIAKNEATSKHKTALVFKSANLQIETKNDTNFLTGTLQLFNTYTHETDKPINIKLQQVIAKNEAISINDKQETRNVFIFPNPTSNNFTISFNLSKASLVKINIYNPQGQVVYTKVFEQLQQGKQNINIPNFKGASGIYQVVVNTNNKQEITAFIKE